MAINRIGVHRLLSSAVVHGNVIYLAGQIGDGETFEEQCKSALDRVDNLLAAAGSDKSRLLQMTIYLADVADFAALNRIWIDWLGANEPPARATVQATLAKPEFKVEFVAVACIELGL